MNFYKRHVGDYLRDTAHLSLLEHGIYTRLLDVYYTREGAIPDEQAARLIGARSKEEREAVARVLEEFFTRDGDAWIQHRCEREIANANAKAERNREVGKLGGRPRKSETGPEPTNNPNGFQREPTDNPSQTPDTRHQTPEKKTSARAIPELPDWLPHEAWAMWDRYRASKKGWTVDAKALSLRKLAALREQGHEPRAVIEQSVERGWTGLFPTRDDLNGHATKAPPEKPGRYANTIAALTGAARQPETIDAEPSAIRSLAH